MIHETIDSNEIIKLFRQFLDANSATRVLYVVGETKLGKSHLLTKVFPTLAQEEYQAYYAIIDLRYPMHTIPDILALTSNQFEGKSWTHYQGAYQAWTTQPTVQLEKICLLLSSVKISAKQDIEELHKSEHNLTTQFIKDLKTYNDRPILLLIDHVDNAETGIQAWLVNSFLVQISLLKHIRVVIAGRSVPEPHGRYAPFCMRCQLRPVTEEDAYIAYCRRLKITLTEQSVRDFARAFSYQPGLFIDYVLPTFRQPR